MMSEDQTKVTQDSTTSEVVEEEAPAEKVTKKAEATAKSETAVKEKQVVSKRPKAKTEPEAPPAREMKALGKDELIATIKNMTVLELSDLVKSLEEEFGVSAAAPMPVAAGPAAAPAAPAEEEKTEFTVILKDMGANKINVIKAVRELTPLGLREAKELVEAAPKAVKENVSKEEAEATKKKLEEAGATVEIK